ncbi:MAG: division/cell wall cluster transcriptional repressor MraZ [Syntrophaceae bacterium]|nr:division/cell wall cluster transcriptional repressor MraZ [Deltaproteobacteria bacterium]
MLKGHFVNSINEKGRLSIPSKFRDILKEWGAPYLVVTKSIDHCLLAFAPDDWSRMEKKASTLSMVKREDIVFKRHFVGSAEDCPIDAQGRILIPAGLREYADLRKKCLLVGIVDRFEIWDQDTYNKSMEEAFEDSEKLRQGLAELGL